MTILPPAVSQVSKARSCDRERSRNDWSYRIKCETPSNALGSGGNSANVRATKRFVRVELRETAGIVLPSLTNRITGEGEKCRRKSISRDAVLAGLENTIFKGRLMRAGTTFNWTALSDWDERKTSLQ